jgi:hypothetical protein
MKSPDDNLNIIIDPSRFRDPTRQQNNEISYRNEMEKFIPESMGTDFEKFENFTKYVSRQTMARFFALYEIFKMALDVQGDVIECGVNWGSGLMSFALMSTILEPVNLQRRIIGFDTFEGFPELSANDIKSSVKHKESQSGGLKADCYDDLIRCIQLYDMNRFINHIPKIELIKGNALETIPQYDKDNPHTVVSLLHLDFDIYEPTKVALEYFFPRMPKGALIVFDEVNNRSWPGETLAVLDSIGIRSLEIKRFPFEPHMSYARL